MRAFSLLIDQDSKVKFYARVDDTSIGCNSRNLFRGRLIGKMLGCGFSLARMTPLEHLIPRAGRPRPTAARANTICASFPDGENVVNLFSVLVAGLHRRALPERKSSAIIAVTIAQRSNKCEAQSLKRVFSGLGFHVRYFRSSTSNSETVIVSFDSVERLHGISSKRPPNWILGLLP